MIEYLSKQEAITILYDKVKQYERTEFDVAHRYGELPNHILDVFKDLDYTVSADSTCYDRVSDTPQFKYWYLEVKFTDDKGDDNKIKGFILATGNGDPIRLGKDVIQISENFKSYSLKVILV